MDKQGNIKSITQNPSSTITLIAFSNQFNKRHKEHLQFMTEYQSQQDYTCKHDWDSEWRTLEGMKEKTDGEKN
jgi:hypothetical protein